MKKQDEQKEYDPKKQQLDSRQPKPKDGRKLLTENNS